MVVYNEPKGQYRLYSYDKLTRKWKPFSSFFYNKDLATAMGVARVKFEISGEYHYDSERTIGFN